MVGSALVSPERLAGGARSQRDFDVALAAVADDGKGDGPGLAGAREEAVDIIDVGNESVAEGDDQVALAQAGSGGGAAGLEAGDFQGAVVEEVEVAGESGGDRALGGGDAEVGAADFAVGEELGDDPAGGVGGDGEAEVLGHGD